MTGAVPQHFDGGVVIRVILALAIVGSSLLNAQGVGPRLSVPATYSNLALSKESGDLNGYELTLVAQSGSFYGLFQCAQGSPSKMVFAPVHLTSKRISFRIEEKDNACDSEYVGVFVEGGLKLHSVVVGDTQFVPRRPSFWLASMPAPTKYERVFDPLFDKLAAACPAKNLEEMAPADLDFEMEKFMSLLLPAQNKRIEALAIVECKDSIAGVGCGNVAFLKIAEKDGLLPRFVSALCAADLVCTDRAVCGPAKK